MSLNRIIPEIINGVYDSGACIKLAYSGNAVYINKALIRTVDIARADTVRLDMGSGALRNIYIRLNDVLYPANMGTAEMLQEYIAGLMASNPVAADSSQQIKDAIDSLAASLQLTANPLSNDALREDESQPSVIYKGYAIPGSTDDQKVWAIVRISRKDGVNISEWAEGNQSFDKVWDARYNLEYTPPFTIR